jgi:hypothetical protein
MIRSHYRRITHALDDCARDTGDDLVQSIKILWQGFDTLIADMRSMTLDACEQTVHNIVRSASYDLVHYATGNGISSAAWRVVVSKMAKVLITMIAKPTTPLCRRTLSIHDMTRGAGLVGLFNVPITSMMMSDVTSAKEYALLLAMYDGDPSGEFSRLGRDIVRASLPIHTPLFLTGLNTAVVWIHECYAKLARQRAPTLRATDIAHAQDEYISSLTVRVSVDLGLYGGGMQRDAN